MVIPTRMRTPHSGTTSIIFLPLKSSANFAGIGGVEAGVCGYILTVCTTALFWRLLEYGEKQPHDASQLTFHYIILTAAPPIRPRCYAANQHHVNHDKEIAASN